MFKNFQKSSFIIYAEFESVLEPENDRKQNTDDSYTNKFQSMLLAVIDIN